MAANDTRISGSAIDGRTTRHPGYALSQDDPASASRSTSAEGKTVGRIRQTVCTAGLSAWISNLSKLTMTASNIVRMARMHLLRGA